MPSLGVHSPWYVVIVKSTEKILSNFVAFLENKNFTITSNLEFV